jgi:UPF0271 protein
MIVERYGDRALRIELVAGIDRRALLAHLRALPGARDAHATETHACVCFDRDPPELRGDGLATAIGESVLPPPRLHRIGIVYDGDDLDEAAALAGLDREAFIALHLGGEYVVSYLGFLPGFAYLRGLDPALASIPRRSSPRPRVPAGAVGIAGGYTAIYPWATPGGWRLIGRAPGFSPLEGDHVRLRAGDRVKFDRIG